MAAREERRRIARPRGPRRGMTLVEVLVAGLVGLVTFLGVHALASSGRRTSQKAHDASSALQNGLLLLSHLREDLSSLAFDPTAVDKGNHLWLSPDRRTLVFNRLEPADDVHGPATKVTYEARRTERGNYYLARTVERSGAPAEEKAFHRLPLEDVTFQALTFRGRHFLRVTFLALGDDYDLGAFPEGARPRARLLSMLAAFDVARKPIRPDWVLSRLPSQRLLDVIAGKTP